jgi:hypothetical protein
MIHRRVKFWQAVANGCIEPTAQALESTMNLIDLIVLACTLGSPGTCQEYHLLYQSAGSPRACAMQAQPYLAQWIGEHPNLRVARWHCAWPQQEDEKT